MIRMRIPQSTCISLSMITIWRIIDDWHYDRAPIVPDVTADDDIGTVRNADNIDGQCRAVGKGNEVGNR